MNLSFDFKKMTTKQYQLTARERLLVIIAIGVIATCLTLYATSSEVTVEPTVSNPNSQKTVSTPNQSVLSNATQVAQVNQVEQPIRDPFAKIPEVQEQKNNLNPSLPFNPNNVPPQMVNNVPAIVQKNTAPTTNLKLTGIVGSTDQRLAVIMSGSKSQSYSLGESVGTYKLVVITRDSVILQNGNDKLVLGLEAAGQKGDNNSAK